MNPSELKSFLDEKVTLYNNCNFIESDPQANTKDVENQIDQLVYKLYDLTEEEIKIVEEV